MLPQSKTGGDSDRFAFHVSMVRNNQHKTLAVCRAEDARERLAIIETCTVDDGAPDPDDLEVSELQRRLAREGSVESLVLPETVRHSADEDSRSSLWGLMSTLRTDSAVETSSSGRRSPHSDIDDGFSPQFHMPFPRRHVDATAEFADGDDVPSPNAERRLLGGLTVLKRRNSCTVDTALLQFPTQLSTPAAEGLSLLGFSSLEPGAATQAPSASAVASAPPAAAEGDEADMRLLEGRIAAEMATVLGDEDAADALEELLSLAKAPTDSEEPPRAAGEDSHSAPRRRFVPLPPPWARDEQEKEPEQQAAISEEQTLPPPPDNAPEEEPPNRTGGFSISHSSRCGPVKRLLSPSATFSSPHQTPVISKMGGVAFQMLLPRATRTFDALRDEWAGMDETRPKPVRELDMEEQREQRHREAESEHQRMCAGLAAAAALPFKDRGVALRMLLAEAARLHERAFNRLLAAAEAALPEAVEKGDGPAAGAQPATPCLRTASPASARSAASAAGFLLTPPAAWEAIMAHAERDLHSCGFQVVQRTLSCMSIFSTRGGATREYGENEHERRRRQEGRMEILAQLRAQGRLFLDEAACAAAVARHNNPLCVAVQAALQRTEWDEAADRREVAEAEFDAWQLLLRRERNALAELTANADDSAAQRWAPSHIVSPSALAGRRGAANAFPSAFPSAPEANDARRADADAPTAVVAVDPQ